MFKKLLYVTQLQTAKLLGVTALITMGGFLDIIGISLVAPFSAVVFSPDLNLELPIIGDLSQYELLKDRDSRISVLGWGLFGVFITKAALAYLTQWSVYRFIYRVQADLRERLIQYFLNLPYEYHLTHESSSAIQSVIVRSERICTGALLGGLKLFADLIVIAALVAIGLSQEPQLLLVAAFIATLVVLVYQRFIRTTVRSAGLESNRLSELMTQTARNSITGFREIKLFGKESTFRLLMRDHSMRFARSMSNLAAASLFTRQMAETLFISGFVALVLVSQARGVDFDTLIPLLSVVAAAGIRIVPAISTISQSLTLLKFSRDSVEDIYTLIHGSEGSQNTIHNSPDSQQSTQTQFEGLSLENVNYQYPGSAELALSDINIEIKPGMTIGIVGVSGSGKSTLLNILLGFLKPTSGSIRHNAHDIHDDLENWHSLLAYVPQSTFVTEGSIESNLSLEIEESSIDYKRLKSSLQQACLADFIDTLPDGLKTSLGDSGQRLSGGQLQRLALARALYNNREILVFDEATSALDPETESQVLNTWSELNRDKTLIMVAHRRETLRDCDVIYEIDNGELYHRGNFDELIRYESLNVRSESPNAI